MENIFFAFSRIPEKLEKNAWEKVKKQTFKKHCFHKSYFRLFCCGNHEFKTKFIEISLFFFNYFFFIQNKSQKFSIFRNICQKTENLSRILENGKWKTGKAEAYINLNYSQKTSHVKSRNLCRGGTSPPGATISLCK